MSLSSNSRQERGGVHTPSHHLGFISQNSEFIALWPPWSRSGRHQTSLSYQVSRLMFPASEPIFRSSRCPASDHRPRGSWGAPHTTEEQRQPPIMISLLHHYLGCNLGVAPSRLNHLSKAGRFEQRCVPLRGGAPPSSQEK